MGLKVRIKAAAICIMIFVSALSAASVYGARGDSGYEGGISSGAVAGKTVMDYMEVFMAAGEPILFKGTLTVKKSVKQGIVSATYSYSLKNNDRLATLSRVQSFTTRQSIKSNGQIVEDTVLSRAASENIKVKDVNYVLRSNDYTRTCIIDQKPAINYFAGNMWEKKTYSVTSASVSGSVTVEITGDVYGYENYWSSVEAQKLRTDIQSDLKKGTVKDKWGGYADINISSSTAKTLRYIENKPEKISFRGGYILSQNNTSILDYSYILPEFDSKGNSTGNLNEGKESLKMETHPVLTRLPVIEAAGIKGNLNEESIKRLASLGILKLDETNTRAEQYITRAEFASIIDSSAPKVPSDPLISASQLVKQKTAGEKKISPFSDVSVENEYFSTIDSIFKRGLMTGNGNGKFSPSIPVKLIDVILVIIRALGLENMAPEPLPESSFKDAGKIPAYAAKAVYAAERLMLVESDENGNLNPSEYLTRAKLSGIMDRYVNYMMEGMLDGYNSEY